MRHRFLNAGLSPIPMGSTAEFACTCGRRGSRATIARHIAESADVAESVDVEIEIPADDPAPRARTTAGYEALVDNEHFGGDTMAHYLPVEPREPAPVEDERPTPPELPPLPSAPHAVAVDACPICGAGAQVADLPEIAAWTCGHWVRRTPLPIAESFQDMLRTAFQAGVAAAASDEVFETWYQREVLQ